MDDTTTTQTVEAHYTIAQIGYLRPEDGLRTQARSGRFTTPLEAQQCLAGWPEAFAFDCWEHVYVERVETVVTMATTRTRMSPTNAGAL